MATNRTEAGELFVRSLARARQRWTEAQRTGEAPDAEGIAEDVYNARPPTNQMTWRDYRTQAGRAVRAVERAHQIRLNPAAKPLYAGIPYEYAINKNESRFRYRVVLYDANATGEDRRGRLFVLGTADTISHDEAVRRARQMLARSQPTNRYGQRLGAETDVGSLTGVVVSLTQFEAGR